MKRTAIILCSLVILLIHPNVVLGDCVDLGGSLLGGFSSFSLEGDNTVILYSGYSGTVPVAQFDVPDCAVESTSKIRLIKSYICDGDEVEIDGSRCAVLSVKPLN